MRFGVLGPLVILDDDGVRPVPVARHRSLLAALLLQAGRAIPLDELAEVVWDGDPPPGARATLRNYMKLLRRSVGPRAAARLITRAPGYLVEAGDDELDLRQFTGLVATGRDAARAGDWPAARERLGAALDLWRGPAFADVTARSIQQGEAAHLHEQRLQALEWRIEADLRLGRHDELVGELQRLTGQEPLRERFAEQLMLALYRAGRQADALAAYRTVRATLDAELAVEPGPALQTLHRRILDADPALAAPAVAADRPAQLPLDLRGFAARDGELAVLDDLLATAAGRPTAVVITAVSGTAGVGKTVLAVHWAHRVAGRFPDGQLYVNLRGFDRDDARVEPAEALRGFLEAMAVPPARIPAGLAERAALYRSTLAGRRMLVLLDNARDEDQVRPLLPGSSACVVLVTSRNQLPGLIAAEGAHPMLLDVLDPAGCRRLLAERIGTARLGADPAAVDAIVDRCARLPLALAVVAARAVTYPAFPLRELADELGALDTFGVRAVFDASYRALPAPAARMFRLLGLHPGPHLSAGAAAGLAGLPAAETRAVLAELVRANLIAEYRPGRYAFHDLLRAYAAELAGTDSAADRAAATRRVLDHYLHTAHRAALLLRPHRDPIELAPPAPGVEPERPADRDAALAWFTAEEPVLLGAVSWAAATGFDGYVWRLAWAGSEYFERKGRWQEHLAVHHAARDAAERAGEPVGLAHAYRGLGLVNARLNRYDEANAYLELALAQSREIGDRPGQARTHNNLGWVLEVQGRYREAIEHATRAYELYRELGHDAGQANALNNIGWYHALDEDFAAAVQRCEQALAVHTAIGDRNGQAATLDSIGYAQHRLGEHGRAIASYRRAVDLFAEEGSRYMAATTLINLGDAYAAAGDGPAADTSWRRALAELTELGHPDAAKVRAKLTGR
ncbi:AfsR/SARP family transcriptional regulator [Paractinoplanes rishiriensis]|uniref:SARP family transcriptional regulator n=1 Tax=Paractinoplanes rishiriensis TaxID=1050105 RepID=A0A919JTD7_9ACTN|nr:BTAD domain-containing putative transcriptional regulator [Actinoplanes rishiriensis]GIE93017.1 SARP family transcriptional regulator [Actinoplanes rishiriensis]